MILSKAAEGSSGSSLPGRKPAEANLHRNFMLASGPLIPAFVEVPAENGKQILELDRNAASSRQTLRRL